MNQQDEITLQEGKSLPALLRLFGYAKKHWKMYILAFSLVLISTFMQLFQPKLVQMLIDHNLSVLIQPGITQTVRDENLSRALTIALFYLGTIVLGFFTTYAFTYINQKIGARIVYDLRREVYNHILGLSMSFYDRHPIGSIVTRVTNDTESVMDLFGYVLTYMLMNFITILGLLVMMFIMNARLTLVILCILPVILAISVFFQRMIHKIYTKERKARSKINTKLSENLTGMSVIQVLHREKAIYHEYDDVNRDFFEIARRRIRYNAIFRPVVEVIRVFGLASILWFGGLANLKGILTYGIVYAFLDYTMRIFEPILNMTEQLNVTQSALASATRIFSLLDEPEEEETGRRPIPAGGFRGKIEFDHVWFRYNTGDESEWILKDVSFTIHPGEFVAFVGATGAGKSTIMGLISRFYDVQKGRILIDGIDVREYSRVDLRRAVGTVQQDVFLFTGDVMSNIRVGREYVSREMAIDAALLVNADDFITRLPKGYDEPVAERGATFSAGQRQLISFARTMAADPSILILDEATANIDTETEQLIQRAIANMSRNRTMIAVAHRISTIADADQIIVMHHGEIAEKGTQAELIAQNGLFHVLYELQYAHSSIDSASDEAK